MIQAKERSTTQLFGRTSSIEEQLTTKPVPGNSWTFPAACSGDKRLAVSITAAVEEEPEEEMSPDYWSMDGRENSEDEISTKPAE